MNNYRSGHWAEFVALTYLRLKGYRKVAANFITGRGTGAGEVDLILRRGKTLVFAEVKKRAALIDAAYAVQPRQKERIRRAAEGFLARHSGYAGFDIRFDAVLVKLPFTIRHVKNAF